MPALWLAHRTEPLVSLPRIAVGCCLQTQQPGGVTTNARSALVQHRLGDLARLANLPAVTGVERQSPERDHPRGVHDGDDRGSMGIEPTVQHHGGVLEATQLQEHLSPRDLGDVQEPGNPRLSDSAIIPSIAWSASSSRSRARSAFDRHNRVRSSSSPCASASPSRRIVSNSSSARAKFAADVLKTALAQREREPGNSVKAPAGGYGL